MICLALFLCVPNLFGLILGDDSACDEEHEKKEKA
jgi:hypothetical protein